MSDKKDSKSPEVMELEDFSKESHSVQTKFISVSLISLFICIFELEEDSKFFGVSAKDVNERVIEFGFFSVAFLLGCLYFLRILEERDVLIEQYEKISEVNKRYSLNALQLKESHEAFVNSLENSPLLNVQSQSSRAYQNLQLAINDEKSSSERFIGTEYIGQSVKKFNERLFKIGQQSLDEVTKSREEAAEQFSKVIHIWNEALSDVVSRDTSAKQLKRFSRRRSFRLWSFDIFLPAALLIAITFYFCQPNDINLLPFFENEQIVPRSEVETDRLTESIGNKKEILEHENDTETDANTIVIPEK